MTRATPASRRAIHLLCVLVVLVFYLRSSWSYGKQLDPAPGRADFQNLQADAFLAGQLNLKIEVPAGLRDLPDPYDAVANQQYRSGGLHDLSYYRGRLYTYFGPAPVVLLYIPFRMLRVGDLSPTLATLLFSAAGFFASIGLVRVLCRRFMRPLSTAAEALVILALGLASPAAWLISIGRAYEAAIASGYFLVVSGLYFLANGLFGGGRAQTAQLAIASALLAIAVGARPTLIVGLVFVAAAVMLVWTQGGAERTRRLSALMVPSALIGLVLAWYNLARFGSLFEFGTGYQLLGENVRVARANELGFLWHGLFDYLVAPPARRDGFPWIGLRPAVFPLPTEMNYLEEPTVGLLPAFPATLLGSLGLLLKPRLRPAGDRTLVIMVGMIFAVGVAVMSLASFHQHSASMRYQMDWAPMFLIGSVVGFLVGQQRLRPGSAARRVVNLLAVVAVAWSAVFAVAITAYPCAGTGSC